MKNKKLSFVKNPLFQWKPEMGRKTRNRITKHTKGGGAYIVNTVFI